MFLNRLLTLTPTFEFDSYFGHLPGAGLVGVGAFPLGFGYRVDRFAHVGRLFEPEEIVRASGFAFVPAHDRFVPKANVSAVEPDFFCSEVALRFFHRLDPLAGAYRVAASVAVGHAQARACRAGDQGVHASASGFGGVVANGASFLLAVFGLHCRVPVEDELVGQRLPDRGARVAQPRACIPNCSRPECRTPASSTILQRTVRPCRIGAR